MLGERRASIVADAEVLRETLQRVDALAQDEKAVIRDLHGKAEGLVRLGVATIAGIIAVVGLALGVGVRADWVLLAALVGGIVA